MKDFEPHQQRVIEEKKELDIKIDKLSAFMDSDNVDLTSEKEQELLTDQMYFMKSYSSILAQRVAHFIIG